GTNRANHSTVNYYIQIKHFPGARLDHSRVRRLALRRLDRQREREAAALSHDARRPDRAAGELDERTREREADAHSGVGARRRPVDLAEALEDVRQLALGDSD